MQVAEQSTKVMTLLLGAIASVSLLVGGIGIMNIMLVSVTERTREIGIRMAVGAKTWDIRLQFIIEALTLSLIGGIMGILLGVGGSKLLSMFAGWSTVVSSLSVIMAFGFSGLVGIFFGFYPAYKASLLNPDRCAPLRVIGSRHVLALGIAQTEFAARLRGAGLFRAKRLCSRVPVKGVFNHGGNQKHHRPHHGTDKKPLRKPSGAGGLSAA